MINPWVVPGRVLLAVANRPRLLAWTMAVDFLGCSAAYGLIEDKGPVESMWWAVVTASTVGYGDQYPATSPGRVVGAFLILSMLLLTWIATAQITARLIQDPHVFTHGEQEQIKATLARIEAALAQGAQGAGPGGGATGNPPAGGGSPVDL